MFNGNLVCSPQNVIQVNGYTVKGRNSIFISASLLVRGKLLRHFLLQEQILYFRSSFDGMQTGSHRVVSLCENGRKTWLYTHTP